MPEAGKESDSKEYEELTQQNSEGLPIIEIEPVECLSCSFWREVDENYMVEKCEWCGDDEYYCFQGYKPE